MKLWKIWLVATVGFFVVVAGIGAYALYRNLDTEWSYEYTAAQAALNKSPVSHITHHSTFSDIVTEEVFEGQDVFGRNWFSFVSGPPWTVNAVPANLVMTKTKVKSMLTQDGIHPIAISLGYLNDSNALSYSAPNHVVWEVYGKDKSGRTLYVYFDAETGKQLWKYML